MNDTISRRAAIDAICEEGVRLERNGMVAMCEIKQWCIDLLDRLPSAQAEPCGDVPDNNVGECEDALGRAENAIGNLPSAQPEIIRCKDCTWFDSPRVCLRHGRFVENNNWFCADGERRRE